jgi:hypothetical protein
MIRTGSQAAGARRSGAGGSRAVNSVNAGDRSIRTKGESCICLVPSDQFHVLVRGPSGERRAALDLESLRPHGKLSFIL